jgi:glycosyl transferase family 2
MPVHTLVRIDDRPIGERADEIRAFMTVRDEMLRLPQTLDHYRKIGVARFFTVDNGSGDGTREFLLAQPDCHVFLTRNSYAEAMYGLEWQQALLNQYGTNHWCLTVDADEWFIYPGYENKRLPDLAAHLDDNGAQGMFTFLLDMYGPGTLEDVVSAPPEGSLLEMSRYFDGEYLWHRRARIPILQDLRFPEYNITGGPRWRVLFPLAHRHYYLMWWLWHFSGYLKIPLPPALKSAPTLTKIPFVRWMPGARYQHPHATIPIKLSRITGVLLHFKFLRDFYTRVKVQLGLEEHRGDGIWAAELERYLNRLRRDPSLKFLYAGSVAYQGSEQLVRLGLMKVSHEWAQLSGIAETRSSVAGMGGDESAAERDRR